MTRDRAQQPGEQQPAEQSRAVEQLRDPGQLQHRHQVAARRPPTPPGGPPGRPARGRPARAAPAGRSRARRRRARRARPRRAARRARGCGSRRARTASVRLPGDGVGRHVPQVVRDEDRAGQRADPGRGVQPSPERQLPVWTYAVPTDRHQPEEDEHHHLAEAEVAVGPRPAGVEPGRDDAERPDEHQPPGGRRRRGPARRPRRRRRRRTPRASPQPGVATPEPTSRSGPTRSASVPRMPSE